MRTRKEADGPERPTVRKGTDTRGTGKGLPLPPRNEGDVALLLADYEQRIERLEEECATLAERLVMCGKALSACERRVHQLQKEMM